MATGGGQMHRRSKKHPYATVHPAQAGACMHVWGWAGPRLVCVPPGACPPAAGPPGTGAAATRR